MLRAFFHSSLRCLLVAGTALIPSVAAGIVIRHDIPDAAYLAKESDFPALFSIYRTKAGHRDCVATVIDARWAVTAAHCARDKRLLRDAVLGGKGYSVEVAGIPASIDKVIHHPGTGAGRAPDLALLRFSSSVNHIAPIPLYRGRDERGRTIVMPGWGGTGNGKSGLGVEDGLFRLAENLVDRVEEGRLWWKFDAPGPNSTALTLEGISGPGDSGGPALIKTPLGWAVAGISSAQDTMGGAEGLYGVEEVFVRVSEFADWIDTNLSREQSAIPGAKERS
ncbi:MAG: S1 family peptidase [Qipengyuania sp.]